MAKFDELSKLAGMPITHEDMVQLVEVWCAFDAHAEGTVPLAQLPELRGESSPGASQHTLVYGVRGVPAHEQLLGEGGCRRRGLHEASEDLPAGAARVCALQPLRRCLRATVPATKRHAKNCIFDNMPYTHMLGRVDGILTG